MKKHFGGRDTPIPTVARSYVREAQRRRRLGDHARCRRCGFPFLEALSRDRRGVICYECQLGSGSALEEHHVLGRAVDGVATVKVPGNVHRMLSELQRSWRI